MEETLIERSSLQTLVRKFTEYGKIETGSLSPLFPYRSLQHARTSSCLSTAQKDRVDTKENKQFACILDST